MSDAISFRPMTEADLDAVLKIEYAAFSHPWTRGIFSEGLKNYHCWLMFEGSQQVGHGVIQIILDEAHLLNITVKPESQGRGLGLRLLEHLMREAAATRLANASSKCALPTRPPTASTNATVSTRSAAVATTTLPSAGAKTPWSWPVPCSTEACSASLPATSYHLE